jgi:hypothetical protein
MVSASSIIAGGLSGLTANFLATFAWRYYSRPEIFAAGTTHRQSIDTADGVRGAAYTASPEKGATKYIISEEESDENRDMRQKEPDHYKIEQVEIKNKGRTVAKNCRPKLILEGSVDEKEYSISTPLCWSEKENPARISINPSEIARFDLFRVPFFVQDDSYVRFPSESGWDEFATIKEVDEQGKYTSIHYTDFIKFSIFSDINWSEFIVEITAENAEKCRGELSFDWFKSEDKVSPELEIKNSN